MSPSSTPQLTVTPWDRERSTWTFSDPAVPESEEAFDTGMEYHWVEHYYGAEPFFRKAIRLCEKHLDARHHLALVLNYTGREEEAFELWTDTFELGRAAIPDEFQVGKDLLEYEVLENRPFLRVTHATGLAHQGRERIEKATQIYEFLLEICPGDNFGASCMLAECYVQLGDPDGVLDLCEQFDPGFHPDLRYARPLALYQQGKGKRAGFALKRALHASPLVGRMLLEDDPDEPEEWRDGHVSLGSEAEAYEYWMRWSPYWDLTEGALEFLEETVAEFDRESA